MVHCHQASQQGCVAIDLTATFTQVNARLDVAANTMALIGGSRKIRDAGDPKHWLHKDPNRALLKAVVSARHEMIGAKVIEGVGSNGAALTRQTRIAKVARSTEVLWTSACQKRSKVSCSSLLSAGMCSCPTRSPVPVYPFVGEGSPTKIDYSKKLVPLF